MLDITFVKFNQNHYAPVSPTPVKVNCRFKIYENIVVTIGNYSNEAF
jgi:hypothetical protein